jgi:hypothetical protein
MLPKGTSFLRFLSPMWAFGNGFSLGVIPLLVGAAATAYSAYSASRDAKRMSEAIGQNAPRPIDTNEAMQSYINSITNPQLQSSIIGAEGTYRPQYQGLNQRDIQNALLGVAPGTSEGYYGTLEMQEMAAQRMAALNQGLQTQNIDYQLANLGAYGPAATQAYLASNPQLQAAFGDISGLGGRQVSGYLNQMGELAMQSPQAQVISPERISPMGGFTPQQVTAQQVQLGGTLTPERLAAERVSAGQVSAQDVGAGSLGASLYQQALDAGRMSPVSSALQNQALSRAQSPGQLTSEELRAATQGAREMSASTGRLESASGVTGEALARAGAARQRSNEDIAMAQQINAQLLGSQQAGQQLATDVLRTDIARQQANVATGLQAGQFNVGTALDAQRANQQAALQASLANQSAGMQAGQFNISNAQDVQRMNQAANLQASLANQAAGMQAYQFGAGQNLSAQELNARLGLSAAESNRGFLAQQQAQQFSNLGSVLGAEQGMLGADRSFALNRAQAAGGITPSALQAIGFGQNAAAIPLGMSAYSAGLGSASNLGPQMFNPDAGINLALAQQANQGNYGAAVAGGQASVAGARAGAMGNITGSLIETLPNLIGNINFGGLGTGRTNPARDPSNPFE